MCRLLPFLALTLIVVTTGCAKNADPVLAAFVHDEDPTNRIVFYASGKYEFYGSREDGSVENHPQRTGTYVGSVSNYVVSIKKEDLAAPDLPTRKVYRIIKHDGVEYLFDEMGFVLIKKYEETKDPRELRHAWRRERTHD